MKNIFRSLAFLTAVSLLFTACDKVEDLPVYNEGVTPVLSSSTASVAPTATDSLSTVATLSWTSPAFATDSAKYKFILSVDTTTSFTHPYTRTVTGALSSGFTAKELNDILLGYGYTFNVPHDLYMQVVASYGNNNEPHTTNTVKLTATAYKVPPKLALPTTSRLFITGGGTDFDWSNPSPMPAVRELTRTDETTWAGIFHMNGGEYLLLQTAGNWDDKFSVTNAGIPAPTAESGSFGFKSPDNFHGNFTAGAGWYKMVYDFQHATYSAVKVDNALSPDLYITGSATPGDWSNTPPDSQKFTQITNGVFEITIAFVPGKEYKFLNTSGQWQPQFGGSSATGGTFGANYGSGSDPANIPTPSVAGNYKINVNFITNTYTVTKL